MKHISQELNESKGKNGEVVGSRIYKQGLKYMSAQLNIIDKMDDLEDEKIISSTERRLLNKILLATAAGRNSRGQILTKAELYIEDLSVDLGYKKVNKIWTLLKGLKNKNLITKSRTRSKGKELIGLNPKFFGQILIDSLHADEQRRNLRIVDKLKKKHTTQMVSTHNPCGDNTQPVGSDITSCVRIEHKDFTDSSRPNQDSLRRQNGESGTLTGEGKTEEFTPEQVAEARASCMQMVKKFVKSMPA